MWMDGCARASAIRAQEASEKNEAALKRDSDAR